MLLEVNNEDYDIQYLIKKNVANNIQYFKELLIKILVLFDTNC